MTLNRLSGSLPSWQAIIFDFDGTLALLNIDFRAMREGVRQLMARFGVGDDGLTDLHILELVEAAGKTLCDAPGEANRFLTEAFQIITKVEMEAARSGRLLEGTRNLLHELQAKGIRTAVVTRNCRSAVLTVFPDLGAFCPVVLTREDLPRVKPHPDHLKAALEQLGVDARHALMVGDHPMDIRLGRDTGTFTLGVLTGHSSREDLIEEAPDFILDRALDLLHLTT